MISLCIPISEAKSYCCNDVFRGIFELNYDKKDLYIIFALDDCGAKTVEQKIEKFISYWPYPENCYIASTTLLGNDPKSSDIIPWKTRARFAATLRNLYTHFVSQNLEDSTHIFSVGSDIVLEPEDLNILLEMDKPIVSGLYVSRIQQIPLALSYHQGNWYYDEVDLESEEPFFADWTGLDCALIKREVYDKVNWDEFSVGKYGVGEDGYFYLEAQKLGYNLLMNPRVKPLHIQEGGLAICAKPVPQFGLNILCHSCGWSTTLGKTWKDVQIKCGKCKTTLDSDPYWLPRRIDKDATGVGIISNTITNK